MKTILILLCGSAFAATNSLTVTELTTSTQTDRPFPIARTFVDGEILNYPRPIINGTPSTAWQAEITTRYPSGYVKHARLAWKATIAGSAVHTVTFQNSTDPCSSGNQAACDAAGLDSISEVLDPSWLSGSPKWDAQIETTGISQTVNARTMLGTLSLASNKVRYWRLGPVVTQVIVEDRSSALSYDFGSDANKCLHPWFVLTFADGWQGVKIEYIVENDWYEKWQNQTYALDLKSAINGAALSSVYTKASFTHSGRTGWRRTFWAGTAWDDFVTPKINIDHNRLYMEAAKVIPTYQPDKIPDATTIANALSAFNASDKCEIMGRGQFAYDFGDTGGRPEIGLWPTWETRWLMTMHKDMWSIIQQQAECAAHPPGHLRESDTAKGSFGTFVSADDRPTEWKNNAPACLSTCSSNWINLDNAHVSGFGWIMWLVTGDYYWQEQMQAWSAYSVWHLEPSTTLSYGRNGSMGIITASDNERGMAWALRNRAHAAVATPDADTTIKQYHSDLVTDTIKAYEGKLNITDGLAGGTGAAWTFGHDEMAPDADSNSYGRIPSPLGFIMYDNSPSGDPNDFGIITPSINLKVSMHWKVGYLHVSLGHLRELGFDAFKLQQQVAKEVINNTVNPTITNPYLQGGYMVPRIRASDGAWFQTWADYWDAYTSTQKAKTSWNAVAPSSDDNNCENGYSHLLRGGASFITGMVDGAYTGLATYNWLEANVNHGCLFSNPQWAFQPRGVAVAPVLTAPPSATQAIISYTAPTEDACTVEASINSNYLPLLNDVNTVLFAGSNLDSRTGSVNRGRFRQFVLGKRTVEYSGETVPKRYSRANPADQDVYVRVTCGTDVGTLVFRSGTIPNGQTSLDAFPSDANRPGETGWPTPRMAGPGTNVSTSTTTVTRVSGDLFDLGWRSGDEYYVNETRYLISSVTNTGTLVLQSSAGTQSNVNAYYGAKNYRYYDPHTGAEHRLFGAPRDQRPGATGTSAFDSATGPDWTNPGNGLTLDGSFATYGGTAQKWLFYKAYRAGQSYFPDFFNAVNFNAKTDTGTEQIQACLTTNVNSSGDRVCDATQPTPVEVTVTTTLTAYTLCRDGSPCNVTRYPGDFLGVGADAIPAIRWTAGENYVSTTASSGVLTFGSAAECNRFTTNDVIRIRLVNHTFSSANCGSNQITVTPTVAFTSSVDPYIYNSGVFNNPRFGMIVRKKATTGSSVISIDHAAYEIGWSYRFGGTSGGMHWMCSPVSSNGFTRCFTYTGSGGFGPVFAINTTTEEIRTLGMMAFFGQTYGFESGQWNVSSFGLAGSTWDPVNPDLYYGAINDSSGNLVLVKMTLNGNDAHVQATEAAPNPLISLSGVTNLTTVTTPGTIRQQVAAWSGWYEHFQIERWNCSLDVVSKDASDNVYLHVPCRRGYPSGQDSQSIVAIFKLNGAKTEATLYALNRIWENNASRGCLLHTYRPVGTTTPLADVEFQYQKGPGGPGFGQYKVALVSDVNNSQTNFSVTSVWNNSSDITPTYGGTLSSSGTTVTGSGTQFLYEVQPGHTITANGQTRTIVSVAGQLTLTTDTAFSPTLSGHAWTYRMGTAPAAWAAGEPVSPYPDKFLTPAVADDVYCFLPCQSGSEVVRIVTKNAAGDWTVSRGEGSTGGPQATSTTPTSHSAGAEMVWMCSSGPHSDQVISTHNAFVMAYWDFVGSTTATNTVYYRPFYKLATGHGLEHNYTHVSPVVGIQWNDNWVLNGGIETKTNWNRYPTDINYSFSPKFAGKEASGAPYQGHPSNWAPAAPRSELFRVYDARPLTGGLSAQSTAATTQVSGNLWRYDYGTAGGGDTDGLSPKHFAPIGTAGDRLMRDISGPGSVITNASSDAFKICKVEVAGECDSGSTAGQVYFNSPELDPSRRWCYGSEVGTEARDICFGDQTMHAQAIIQLTVPDLAPQAASYPDVNLFTSRVISRMWNYWRRMTATCNVKLTPDGKYLMHGCGGHDRGSFLIKVPRYAADSVTRNTFSAVKVQVGSAPAGTSRAVAQFGYDPNFYCMPRTESCYAVGSTITEATPFQWAFELTSSSGPSCASGCVISIPALSGRVVYHRIVFRDGSGNTVATGPVNVSVAP